MSIINISNYKTNGVYTEAETEALTISVSTANYHPWNGYYDFSMNYYIYTPTEIGTAKTISSMSWNLLNYSTPYTLRNVTIKLAHTTNSTFSTTPANAVPTTTLGNVNNTNITTCFSGNLNIVNGWFTVSFTTSFVYTGGNLLVIIENRDGNDLDNVGGSSGDSSTNCYKYTGSNRAAYKYVDNSDTIFTISNSMTVSSELPFIKINGKYILDEIKYHIPFTGSFNYSTVFFIYKPSEVGSSRLINNLSWNISSSNYTINNITITLAHTSNTVFSSSTKTDLTEVNNSNITTCFNGNITVSGTKVTSNFTTPFMYNGINNLLIIFENNNGSIINNILPSLISVKTSNRTVYLYQDTSITSGSVMTATNFSINFTFNSAGNYDGMKSVNFSPFNLPYLYNVNYFIYTPSEIGLSQTINCIAFQLKDYTNGYTINNVTVKLAHTTDYEFTNNIRTDLTGINTNDLTTCFIGTVNTANGLLIIKFVTPFNYDNTKNMLLVFENMDGTNVIDYGNCIVNTINSNRTAYRFENTTDILSTKSMTLVNTVIPKLSIIRETLDKYVYYTDSDIHPFNGNFKYGINYFIYLPSEVGVGGDINSITMLFNSQQTTINNVTIKLAHTTNDNLSGVKTDLTNVNILGTEPTTCFNGVINMNNGWITINFSSAFTYNGTSKLLVIFESSPNAASIYTCYVFNNNYRTSYLLQNTSITSGSSMISSTFAPVMCFNSVSNINYNPVTMTESTINYHPWNGWYDFSMNYYIYTPVEIGAAKTISSMSWNLLNYSMPYTLKNVTIKLAHTTNSTFSFPTTTLGNVNNTNITTCFSGNLNIVNGWFTVSFTTSFVYTGGNLLVIIENRDGNDLDNVGGSSGDSSTNCYKYTGSNRAAYQYVDDSATMFTSPSSMTVSSELPFIKINNNAISVVNKSPIISTRSFLSSFSNRGLLYAIYYPQDIYTRTIKSITLRLTGFSTNYIINGFHILMAHTTNTVFTSPTADLNGVNITNMTTCFKGNVVINNGLFTFNFTTPFVYDGSSNLLLMIQKFDTINRSTSGLYNSYESTSNRVCTLNTSSYIKNNTMTTSTQIPQILFN